jgi:hypothetical protein
MKYPLVFYTTSLPEGVAGRANGPIIRINNDYKDDYGLYKHELMHVKQWFFTLGIHPILYKLIPKYRLWAEVQCYKEQARHYQEDKKSLFSKYIAERYNINISQEQALTLLNN